MRHKFRLGVLATVWLAFPATTYADDDSTYKIEHIRIGTRCGTSDSIEADIVNTSKQTIIGDVFFAGNRVSSTSGNLAPGSKVNVYTCHGSTPITFHPKPVNVAVGVQSPVCPGYTGTIPPRARSCRSGETPAVIDFYGKHLSCSWCY